jgi:hypothetical protein
MLEKLRNCEARLLSSVSSGVFAEESDPEVAAWPDHQPHRCSARVVVISQADPIDSYAPTIAYNHLTPAPVLL